MDVKHHYDPPVRQSENNTLGIGGAILAGGLVGLAVWGISKWVSSKQDEPSNTASNANFDASYALLDSGYRLLYMVTEHAAIEEAKRILWEGFNIAKAHFNSFSKGQRRAIEVMIEAISKVAQERGIHL